ncbi:hypothetical protein M404DRAFT_499468 [Pisolithus tinctorius Marx 270]|uniref:Uncharacterized protein n=1 Tax=Pisolithus tinctorius Marx 270 TaxID=870435 RepID=A0A0C3PDI0_PISTI|nr:hypothetical protein M404DRAFT_499468 [Pisolithus tinctorius Marx 270]
MVLTSESLLIARFSYPAWQRLSGELTVYVQSDVHLSSCRIIWHLYAKFYPIEVGSYDTGCRDRCL